MPKSSKRLLPLILLVALSPILAACPGTPQPTLTIATTTKPDCVNWKVISYSLREDSPETVRQIIASNAARAKACKG